MDIIFPVTGHLITLVVLKFIYQFVRLMLTKSDILAKLNSNNKHNQEQL